MTRDLFPLIESLLSKKSASPQITSSSFKLLELLSRTAEGIEYMKKNNALQTIVRCMEKHPYDKEILSNGSAILSKIVTISDLNQVLEVMRKQQDDENSLLNIPILSQLALIDEMMDEMLKQGALKELIRIIEINLDANPNESIEKMSIIKNCCIALGRIIDVDVNQFKEAIDLGALKLLKRTLIEIKNAEIIGVALNTLNKLLENSALNELILDSEGEEFLANIFKSIEKFKDDLKCCESFLNFLNLNSKNPLIYTSIFEKGGLEMLLQIMEKHINNKNIQEKV